MSVILHGGFQEFYITSFNNACCYILCHLTEKWKERLKSEVVLKYLKTLKHYNSYFYKTTPNISSRRKQFGVQVQQHNN